MRTCASLLRCLLLATLVALPATAGARTLKIATVVPEGSAWMREMRQVAQQIEDGTDGRVGLKFYPGGVMGNDKTVLRKIRAGQLHGGAFTSGGLASVFPDLELYGIPLLFRSYAEVDYVRQRMDAEMVAGFEKAGFQALAISDGGFAYLMSQEPTRQVGDLAGRKVWIQEGDVMSETAFEVAGVAPTPLPLADVYTALQTGLIDTVAGPAMGVIALQWHTKLKYLTDVPLSYLTGVFVIDDRAFAKLTPADQKVLREAVQTAGARLDAESREGESGARDALRAQGIEFVTASTPEEVQRWHDIAGQALSKLREKGIYSPSALDEIQRHLREYRSAQGAP